jgi:hypothetical protein
MRSTCKSKLSLAFTGLLPGVLLACLAVPVSAQAGTESQPARGVVAQYDAAHEVTISGTVQKVVTKRTVGSPTGMHLLVSGAHGVVDAHVGPYLNKSMQQALHMGLPVQIVGSMVTIRGKELLLARQVIYGGQTVTVRNNKGFLYHPAQSSLSPTNRKNPWMAVNGGAL